MRQSLYEKVFNRHVVREVMPGQYQLAADLHLLNEVSSPPAFEALRDVDEQFSPGACGLDACHVTIVKPGRSADIPCITRIDPNLN